MARVRYVRSGAEPIARCILFSLVAEGRGNHAPRVVCFTFPAITIIIHQIHHRYNHLSKLSGSRSARSNLVHRLKDVRCMGEGLGRSRRGAPWRCKEVPVVCKKLHATSLYKHRVSLQAFLLGSSAVVGPIQRPLNPRAFLPQKQTAL